MHCRYFDDTSDHLRIWHFRLSVVLYDTARLKIIRSFPSIIDSAGWGFRISISFLSWKNLSFVTTFFYPLYCVFFFQLINPRKILLRFFLNLSKVSSFLFILIFQSTQFAKNRFSNHQKSSQQFLLEKNCSN